ncbi:Tenascin-X [Dirofilaria immitis]
MDYIFDKFHCNTIMDAYIRRAIDLHHNECYFNNNIISPNDCEQVECSIDSRCYKGRCYPAINLPCDRNVELSQHRSKSITSNCGQKGKCVNGRCVEDRCAGIMCTEDEICRDGKCLGTCHSAIGQDCTRMACQGNTICVEGRCILDPCTNRCPSEHACREGQCRHLHGLLCLKECPKPYVCIDGLCIRNECFGKSCQPGEACQNGFCINVEKRLCSLAIRDCAEGFECIEGTCHDLLVIEVNTTTLS